MVTQSWGFSSAVSNSNWSHHSLLRRPFSLGKTSCLLAALHCPWLPHSDKGYQCCDNRIGGAHGEGASEDPEEVPHGLEEGGSVKRIGILLGTVDGYRAEKRKGSLVGGSQSRTLPSGRGTLSSETGCCREEPKGEKRRNEVERAASAPCLFQAHPTVSIDCCQSVNICISGEP